MKKEGGGFSSPSEDWLTSLAVRFAKKGEFPQYIAGVQQNVEVEKTFEVDREQSGEWQKGDVEIIVRRNGAPWNAADTYGKIYYHRLAISEEKRTCVWDAESQTYERLIVTQKVDDAEQTIEDLVVEDKEKIRHQVEIDSAQTEAEREHLMTQYYGREILRKWGFERYWVDIVRTDEGKILLAHLGPVAEGYGFDNFEKIARGKLR